MSSQPNPPPKEYEKPKILLIDCHSGISEMLSDMGLNVRKGTFGRPYGVSRCNDLLPVIGEFSLPNASEQEIVVLDLSTGPLLDRPRGAGVVSEFEEGWWARCLAGTIDPRPLGASLALPHFRPVIEHGAVFIIFAAYPHAQEFESALRAYDRGPITSLRRFSASMWHFLDALGPLLITYRTGNEMTADEGSELGRLLSPFLSGSKYECVFPKPLFPGIARNKHGEVTAFATDFATGMRILVVPQLVDKVEFVRRLITEFLPRKCPEFFPEFGSKTWVHAPEYELPEVLELARQSRLARDEYDQQIRVIDQKIGAEQEKNGWMHRLLTESGDELVSAVREALRVLGFSDVKDVDSERDTQGQTRREDLQILDASPAIIVDVKGLNGVPKDSDIQQPGKHAMMRMNEWKSTDVNSLFIVNQERNIPPLARSDEPFRPEMVTHSEDVKTGLLTTWDLYRMVRGHWENGWPVEHIKPLFYTSGRILPVPTHYEGLGSVTHSFTNAFTLMLERDVKVGDRLAWEVGNGFIQCTVVSLQLNDKSVDSAQSGAEVGIKTDPLHSKLKEGQEIYRIAV